MRPDHTGAIPTASSATIEQYTKVVQSLRRQCARDLGVKVSTLRPAPFIDWFVRQHGRWSDNTIRVYRRAVETYLHAMCPRQVLSPDELCQLLTMVYPGPRACQSANEGTATTKAYVTTEDEVQTVGQAAHLATDTDARIIELLCKLAPDLALRPGEWAAARIHDDLFIVPNSKHSNGRANGPYRAIFIDTMPLPDRHELSELCRLLSDAVKSAGKWKKVNQRLASRLARICEANNLRRLCLYAFRGTACARYKDAGLTPVEIAALMGHAVDTTSYTHYPRARQVRSCWRRKIVYRPHPRCVATVRKAYRDPSVLRSKPANQIPGP
jgi:integrase